MSADSPRELEDELVLMHATMRLNALIFGGILGALTGAFLLALAVAATLGVSAHAALLVRLLGVFLPGYGTGVFGLLAGLFWGLVLGGALGAGIYWINYRRVLSRVDELVSVRAANGDLPSAVLRLHGPSLGVAVGVVGALGLVVTTNWLVLRGTAHESIHAYLLSQVLPGYAVDLRGSLIGAAELFAVLFVFCVAFATVYNRVADARRRRR